jgi:hypothetical protein
MKFRFKQSSQVQPTLKALHRNRRRNGQGLVEFALIAPILLMTLFAIVDFSWVVFNYAGLFNGLREATRYGSVPGFGPTKQYMDCAGLRNIVAGQAGWSGIANDPTGIAIKYDDGRPSPIPGTSPAITLPSTTAYCGTVGSPTTISLEGSYSPPTGGCSTCRTTANPVQNGDRIVITLTTNVHFLTPFLNTMVPGGFPFSITGARTVFPSGV